MGKFHGGVALGLSKNLTTQGDAVINHDAISDFGGLTNHDAHAVVNEETAANGGSRVNLNAGEEAVNLRQNSCRATPSRSTREWNGTSMPGTITAARS